MNDRIGIVEVPVVLVALIAPNVPIPAARIEPVVSEVVAAELVKKFAKIGVVVETTFPDVSRAKNVLARLVSLSPVSVEVDVIWAVPPTERSEPGVDEPMPTFPFERSASTLCVAEPKNSAILPAPDWRILKNVEPVEVAFC